MNKLMTTEEVAELCRTSIETVRYWRYIEKGPKSFKVGRRVLYAAEDVDAWLTDARTASVIAPLQRAQDTADAVISSKIVRDAENEDRITTENDVIMKAYRNAPRYAGHCADDVAKSLGISLSSAYRRIRAARTAGLI